MDQLTAEFGGARRVGTGIGPVLEKFGAIRRIAVLRGGGLGDLMFALPAVTALAAAYPEAEITLLGTPVHRDVLAVTDSPVTHVEVLPHAEGVRPGKEDPAALDAFFRRMQAMDLDLAVQLHGGGRNSNPFLLRLGARHTVGTKTPDAAPLERSIPYLYYQHEPLRALEVAGLAGAYPRDLEARLTPTGAGVQKLPKNDGGSEPLVVIHPGATDPRRRWPPARFAVLARACADSGFRVTVVGHKAEQPLAAEVVAGSGSGRVRSLAGSLDMAELVTLLASASVVVGNDSGPRHLAQALGVPTVGIYWAGNIINAGALGRSLHRLHASWVTSCPVCGIDVTQVGWTAPRCPHDESLVADVPVGGVFDDVRSLAATDRSGRRA